MRKNKKGFTLIELILVIAILGILAVAVLPKFYDLSDDAYEAQVYGAVGAINAGILVAKAKCIVNGGGAIGALACSPSSYPSNLDNLSQGDVCSDVGGCFGTVLDSPLTAAGWVKGVQSAMSSNYNYTAPGGGIVCYFMYVSTDAAAASLAAPMVAISSAKGPRTLAYCAISS